MHPARESALLRKAALGGSSNRLSPEALALKLSLAAQCFALVCLVCQQAVTDIRSRGQWFVRVPYGQRVQTVPTDD